MFIHAGAIYGAMAVAAEPQDIVDMVDTPSWSMDEDDSILHGSRCFDCPEQAAGDTGDLHDVTGS